MVQSNEVGPECIEITGPMTTIVRICGPCWQAIHHAIPDCPFGFDEFGAAYVQDPS